MTRIAPVDANPDGRTDISGICIGGRFQRGRGPVIEIRSPFSDELVGAIASADAADVEDAVSIAHDCFKRTMRRLPVHVRARILNKAADLLTDRAEDIARCLTRESGKPISLSRVECRRGGEILRLAAQSAQFVTGEVVPLDALSGADGRVGLAMRTPLGVVAAISPFNAPVNLSLQKVAPALAAGCTVVLKPADPTPHTVLMLAKIFADAGLPEGALSILPGAADMARAIVTHPKVAVVSFTGSTAVAEKIQSAIGIKKVIYELGSNAPNVVCADADLDLAAKSLVASAFNSSGQICVSAQRIFAHESVYDSLVERMIPLIEALKIGDPMDETVTLGSLISRAALDRIDSWVTEAVLQGATALTGGGRHRLGHNYMPTLLANVSPQMKVQCQEVFGPVVTISRFQTDEEAVDLCNASPYGLRAGVFTRDLGRAFFYARELEVGGMSINDTSRFRQDNTPSSGIKSSGVGQEGGRYAYEEYTYLKFVALRLG